MKKSGVAEQDMNFPGRESIFSVSEQTVPSLEDGLMGYSRYPNAIVIDAAKLSELAVYAEDPSLLAYIFLSSLIHEYTHATGANVQRGNATAKGGSVQSAYNHQSIESYLKNPISTYQLFNEGMTELIERQVTAEYVKRNPIEGADGAIVTSSTIRPVLEGRGKLPLSSEYLASLHFVERLIRHVADACELPEDILRDAFIAGYFNGSAFQGDSGELLDEVMGEGFRVALAHATTEQDLEKIANEHAFAPVTLSLKEAIFKLFPQVPRILDAMK